MSEDLTRPKWAFKYIVLSQQGVTTFSFLDCAHRFALATHGTLYPVEAVLDYDAHTMRRDRVQIKAGHQPIEVD